jgi:1,4-alpha-glucan branching enzyme
MNNLGGLIIVLHCHIPYGLEHDPMEEHWIYEAAAETYVPLLEMAARLDRAGIKPNFAVSFTPVLLDQLADHRFKRGFKDYLATHARLAEEERQFRGKRGEIDLARLQRMWRDYYANILAYFADMIDEDIPGAFRRASDAGSFELLTSAATHGYLPLLGLDENVRAQIELGRSTYQRHFGRKPRGFWLPECAFRPAGRWSPPIQHQKIGTYDRRGVDDFLRDSEIDYFFIDQAQLKMSPPRHGNNSPLRLHRVGSSNDPRRPLGTFTRDFAISKLVWQSYWGYPGDFLYLEFHKKVEQGQFRLWRISGSRVSLEFKQEYDPPWAQSQVRAHARHFLGQVRGALGWHHAATGERGCVVAAFDAELFGHWWFEGIPWLETIARTAAEEQFSIETPSQYFDRQPPKWHVELRESSWGLNNDHTVWLHRDAQWVWRNIYEAETAMQHLGYLLNGREIGSQLADALRQAMRELLILEASDWIFMISTWSTRDHAERRSTFHYNDFKRLAHIVGRMAAGEAMSEDERNFVRETAARNAIFPELDLNLFWRGKFNVREAPGAKQTESRAEARQSAA